MDNSLKKSERLCHVKVIDSLFDRRNGGNKSNSAYPVLMIYSSSLTVEGTMPKVLFSVPKRKFKRAVERNLIKRRLREAYRLHKNILQNQASLRIAFLYTAKESLEYSRIEEAMIKLLGNIKN